MNAKNRVGPNTYAGAINEANVHMAVVGGANNVALLHRATFLGLGFACCAFNFGFADGERHLADHQGGHGRWGEQAHEAQSNCRPQAIQHERC